MVWSYAQNKLTWLTMLTNIIAFYVINTRQLIHVMLTNNNLCHQW